MTKKMTLSLAALMLTLTFSAFPHHAAASTTTSTTSVSDMTRAGGSQVKYLVIPFWLPTVSCRCCCPQAAPHESKRNSCRLATLQVKPSAASTTGAANRGSANP